MLQTIQNVQYAMNKLYTATKLKSFPNICLDCNIHIYVSHAKHSNLCFEQAKLFHNLCIK